MTAPTDVTVAAWVGLVRAHAKAMGVVQAAFRGTGLPSLEWYDVLLELERDGPVRPHALQRRLLVAQYSLSRLVDRMVDAGLVERSPAPGDKRGQQLAITDLGRVARRNAWPAYAAAIEAALGARLSGEETRHLTRLLSRIAAEPDGAG